MREDMEGEEFVEENRQLVNDMAEDLEKKGFNDGIDVNPEISLFEYGILREGDSGRTLFWDRGTNKVKVDFIEKEDVVDALKEASDGFYSFIGQKREEVMDNVKEGNGENLATIINSLNQYNGWFAPYRSRYRKDAVEMISGITGKEYKSSKTDKVS